MVHLFFPISLFVIALWGMFGVCKNIVILLMCIEIMFLSASLQFVLFSMLLDDLVGQVVVLFILTIAAAEAAIVLALVVLYFRVYGSATFESLQNLKG